nr:hypothetical protein [Tanacetum cinerariifolium]
MCGDDFDNYIDGDDETYQDCVGDMVGATDSPQITLNALSGLNSYQTMRGSKGMLKQADLSFMALCVYPMQLCQMESVGSVSTEVKQVLTQFDEVFEVPKDLPPHRSHDHQIPLMPNTPPINELINELNSSVVFFKLDLRSGYHQIRLKEDDIFFKAFLRKFVLVFFDNILTYSKNLEEHCDHLAQVLQVMEDNTLYARLSVILMYHMWSTWVTLSQLKVVIKYYASISQPLVALTKKDAFKWNPSTELAYHKLNEAMVKAPVLALPNFKQEFVVESDASGKGIRAVIEAALDKWKGYLLDRHFKIRTDHFSLKYLLNQKLTTSFQFKWLPKLLGYDYLIVYKKGSRNVVADALSRMDSSGELLQIYVSSVSSGIWDKGNEYSWTGGILKRKGKVLVRNDPELRKELKGLKIMVKQMIRDCNVCQRQKPDLSAYPGLIQPLPIPERIWKEISMDFIEKLPTSYGKLVIVVVVDRLIKYAHFIPLTNPSIASQVAQVFLDQVYKLHGLPESIVSDRDKVFLSNFWKALFAELKVKLKLSTAYHPQTDGQTKVVNRSLGCYLRCMCGEKSKEWVKWLPLAEFWYNTNYHTSTKTTPYEAVYCQTPHIHVPYIPGDSRVEEVDRTLQAREEAIKVLKFHLKRSQDRMRNQANKHR